MNRLKKEQEIFCLRGLRNWSFSVFLLEFISEQRGTAQGIVGLVIALEILFRCLFIIQFSNFLVFFCERNFFSSQNRDTIEKFLIDQFFEYLYLSETGDTFIK